jgi:hypothetical protein
MGKIHFFRDGTIRAAKEHEIPGEQIIDAQSIPTDLYGITGIPQIILFCPDGKIVAKGLRGDGIKSKLTELLKK